VLLPADVTVLLRLCDPRSGYGGALSVYFGLSAGLQQLHVSHISLGLMNNVFESCVVSVSVSGGNAYGGAVSIYMGAYSSRYSSSGDVVAAAGDTVVRNVSVLLDAARFASCSARREISGAVSGSNVYGGSFSFYIGAYAWSQSVAGSSSSTCGATDAIGVNVRLQHVASVDCTAFTHVGLLPNSTTSQSLGANSYGGAISAVYVGAYSWSRSIAHSSSSKCEATIVSRLSMQVSDSGFSNCSAAISSMNELSGANSYGGAMSAVYVGAYSWSRSDSDSSSSKCEATNASGLSVQVGNSSFSECGAVSSSNEIYGANSYGGAMSAVYVGAYSWSRSHAASSNSTCDTTDLSGLSVQVSNSGFSNCSFVSKSMIESRGVNSYGGAMSAVYVGAYAFSRSALSSSSCICEATDVSGLSVQVSDSVFSNCSAVSSSMVDLMGANSYGGAISAVYVGAYSLSRSNSYSSSSKCEATIVSGLSVQVSNSGFSNCSVVISVINSTGNLIGANSYGGAISAVYVGAYSFCRSVTNFSNSKCEATNASGLSVQVSNSGFSNCSAVSSFIRSFGVNSYGGAMSAVYVGAYSYSYSYGQYQIGCASSVAATHVHMMSIKINNLNFEKSMALIGQCHPIISNSIELTQFEISAAGSESLGANVSSSIASVPVFVCHTAMWWRVTLRRFMAVLSVSWLGLLCGHILAKALPPHHAVPSSARSVASSLRVF
jgi:hypothetical protein